MSTFIWTGWPPPMVSLERFEPHYKELGLGRKGSKYGMDEYCDITYGCIGI